MASPILEIRQLVKTFGALRAVDGVSFQLQAGECLGLLGPNGAGKTTTISMITGLLAPASGQVLIEGKALAGDGDPAKRRIGLVPQDLALYEELTALDNLKFFGALYDLEASTLGPAMTSALELVGLADRAGDRVKNFSGGMKRRLNLASALLHDPQLLLLDEPTVGVDPQSRNAIFDNIAALRARGKTVLYTTHYMEEVERLCDRVVIMDHGQVVADDTLAGLQRRQVRRCRLRIELEHANGAAWLGDLRQVAGVLDAELAANNLTVGLADLGGTAAVLGFLSGRGQTVLHLESDRPNLEAVFLELTGRNLRDS
jgi:ABC-2 type transport system ATP-binding protein